MKNLIILLIAVGLVYGIYVALDKAFAMEPCPACDGKGEVVNPAVRSDGIPVKCNWCNGMAQVQPDEAKKIRHSLGVVSQTGDHRTLLGKVNEEAALGALLKVQKDAAAAGPLRTGAVPPAPTPPTAAAASNPAGPPRTMPSPVAADIVSCTKDVEAFDPDDHNKPIGTFLKDTILLLGSKDSSNGKIFVTYKEVDGKAVQAWCRAEDLGK